MLATQRIEAGKLIFQIPSKALLPAPATIVWGSGGQAAAAAEGVVVPPQLEAEMGPAFRLASLLSTVAPYSPHSALPDASAKPVAALARAYVQSLPPSPAFAWTLSPTALRLLRNPHEPAVQRDPTCQPERAASRLLNATRLHVAAAAVPGASIHSDVVGRIQALQAAYGSYAETAMRQGPGAERVREAVGWVVTRAFSLPLPAGSESSLSSAGEIIGVAERPAQAGAGAAVGEGIATSPCRDWSLRSATSLSSSPSLKGPFSLPLIDMVNHAPIAAHCNAGIGVFAAGDRQAIERALATPTRPANRVAAAAAADVPATSAAAAGKPAKAASTVLLSDEGPIAKPTSARTGALATAATASAEGRTVQAESAPAPLSQLPFDGEPVVCCVSSRAIEPFEEILSDYAATNGAVRLPAPSAALNPSFSAPPSPSAAGLVWAAHRVYAPYSAVFPGGYRLQVCETEGAEAKNKSENATASAASASKASSSPAKPSAPKPSVRPSRSPPPSQPLEYAMIKQRRLDSASSLVRYGFVVTGNQADKFEVSLTETSSILRQLNSAYAQAVVPQPDASLECSAGSSNGGNGGSASPGLDRALTVLLEGQFGESVLRALPKELSFRPIGEESEGEAVLLQYGAAVAQFQAAARGGAAVDTLADGQWHTVVTAKPAIVAALRLLTEAAAATWRTEGLIQAVIYGDAATSCTRDTSPLSEASSPTPFDPLNERFAPVSPERFMDSLDLSAERVDVSGAPDLATVCTLRGNAKLVLYETYARLYARYRQACDAG